MTAQADAHAPEPEIVQWVREDTASLLATCDRVFGIVTVLIGLAGLVSWLTGHTSFSTMALLVVFPAVNLILTKLGTGERRLKAETARVIVNVPLTAFAYVVRNEFFSNLWILALIMVAGNALAWPTMTRRVRDGYLTTLIYTTGVLVANCFAGDPRWDRTVWHVIAFLVVGFSFSEATGHLGAAVVQARLGRREAEHNKQALEQSLQNLSEAQERLVAVSRTAGMAEVATGVLHNVGNVLNSVNVSGQLIAEQLEKSKLKTLGEVARLLEQQRAALPEFLTRDPRGQKVLPLLQRLIVQLESEHASLRQENALIREHIEHVKVIIGQQQELATSTALLEECTVAQLVDAAATLMLSSFGKHGIEIVRKLDNTPKLTVDRHLVMQILINLLANAKQASAESGSQDKRVTIRSGIEGDLVFIEVSDSGVGIAPENLSKIFNHGFTTKKGGHGFGLHSSCNTARALGGDLRGMSPGPGRGAVFTLTLPVAPRTASAA